MDSVRFEHWKPSTRTVIEGSGRSRCEAENARWVNVVLSNLKRSLDGAYHAFKFAKYAQRYLAETMWRFNRRFDLTRLVPSCCRRSRQQAVIRAGPA